MRIEKWPRQQQWPWHDLSPECRHGLEAQGFVSISHRAPTNRPRHRHTYESLPTGRHDPPLRHGLLLQTPGGWKWNWIVVALSELWDTVLFNMETGSVCSEEQNQKSNVVLTSAYSILNYSSLWIILRHLNSLRNKSAVGSLKRSAAWLKEVTLSIRSSNLQKKCFTHTPTITCLWILRWNLL